MRAALFGFRRILLKEFLHISRDRTTLVFALVVPLLQLVLFGYAINFDVRHVRTVVVDLDHSAESAAYIQRLQNTEELDVVKYAATPDAAVEALRRNDERVAVIIPADFHRTYGTGKPAVVHVLIDGSDGQVAGPARAAFAGQSGAAGPAAVDARVDVLFNPDIRTAVYTIPGLVCVLLQLVTVSLTSFSLVREREQGTLEQLMVTPVGRLGLILGKIVPYALLALAELVAIVFLGRLIFDIPVAGSFLLLVVLSIPFILAALSMGIFISTTARNQVQAMQMTMLTTMPSILLSGYIAPRETLPPPLYIISDIFPVTWFIQISRGIMVRGAGIADLWTSVIPLCLIAVVLIAAATMRFHKSAE